VGGKVLTSFGRAFDPRSKLYIFKKGIDIQSSSGQPVLAIFPGKIAYSGELPEYGRVTIVDHGNHFYSLCAHLGELSKKAGETVAAGDAIGLTDETGVVYFEIRARNVPVNPLQWVADSFSLKK
jgi:septal ring factor EnvC (AmiA/AmiB activator)